MPVTTANPAVAPIAFARQNVGSPSAPGVSNITHLFLYRTAHTRAQVEAAGYFNAVRGRLTVGSVINVVYGVGGAIGFESYLVTSVTAGSDVTWSKAVSGASLTDNTGGNASVTTLALALSKSVILIPIAAFSGLANSQVIKVLPGYRFKLLSTGIRPVVPVTTASKLATLTPQISGSAVTGGVISATSAGLGTTGTIQSGTAVTAANTGAATDTLEFAVSAVTAFVEGNGFIEASVQNLDLADAIASLNAA
jgi:hypothetical protein